MAWKFEMIIHFSKHYAESVCFKNRTGWFKMIRKEDTKAHQRRNKNTAEQIGGYICISHSIWFMT